MGFGASANREVADSNTFDSLAGGQPERRSLGAYLEPTIAVGDTLKIEPALRYDWSDDYAAGISSMLGLVWQAGKAVDVHLSGGRSYTAPTFNQLYYPTYSNPDLKSDSAWNVESGFTYKDETLTISASTFARLIDNMIVNDAFFIPQNIGRAFTPGAELTLAARFGHVRLKSDYEFIYPLDVSSDGGLANASLLKKNFLSMHKASASLAYRVERFELGMGGRYWSAPTDDSLPSVFLLNANGSFWASRRIKIMLSAENILDRSYEVIEGYPMPGLTLTTGLRVEL
jgi:vitamin B12 transporter